MKNIAVLGLGKVGTLVAVLLQRKYQVTGIDKNTPHYEFDLPFNLATGDVSDVKWLTSELKKNDAVLKV